jgi:anaerobic magnesium-protoporphyrin IX monomethyl ester cyclase
MTRVLLVACNQERRPYPVPPLGLCLVAEALCPEHEVRIFDGMFDAPEALRRLIGDFDPDYIGLGIRNVEDPVMERPREYLPAVRDRFVQVIRESTRSPLILGGAGYSLFPQEILALLEADYGVIGEGEAAFRQLIEALEAGQPVDGIAGVVQAGAAPRAPVTRGRCGDSADIGPSHLDRWLDFAAYSPRGTYSIQTKRGCAHRCIYCSYPSIEGSAYRLRNPESIVDELEAVRDRLGAETTFEFVDSILNDPKGHAEAICEELIRRRSKVRLRAMGLNPRGVTPELLSLMKRAGFVQMDCTPDSAAPAVLERLGKGFTVEALERAAEHIRAAAIPTIWFFLFGGPGETEETFDQTMAFIDDHIDAKDMVYMWAGLRVYPNTRLAQEALALGLISPEDSLLQPVFYISPELGRRRCVELIEAASHRRANCVPAWEAAPDQAMLRQALELRARLHTTEPMFRTLIRLRRQMMGVTAHL